MIENDHWHGPLFLPFVLLFGFPVMCRQNAAASDAFPCIALHWCIASCSVVPDQSHLHSQAIILALDNVDMDMTT
jgi:hypothetical protein